MAIKISKIFFVLLIFYYGWFQVVFFQVPHALLILGAGMTGFIIIDVVHSRTNIFQFVTLELIFWILFAVTSLVFGWFVAVNREFLTGSVSTFVQYLILIYGIIYISNKDGNIDFFIKAYMFYAVICAITTLTAGIVDVEGRAIMAPGDNPNSVGINMAVGICCLLYTIDFKRLVRTVVQGSCIFLMIYVTLLSGSRKSFISIVLIILFWFVLVVTKEMGTLTINQKVKVVFLIFIAAGVTYYFLYDYFKSSIILDRLTALFQGSETTRLGMYDEALEMFKGSPLVGVGFNNFRAVSVYGTYSHSTFAEALACTGIIGSILYFIPYITTAVKYIRILSNKEIEYLYHKQAAVLLGLLGVLTFLAIGLIHFYEMNTNAVFGMIFAFSFLHGRHREEAGNEDP